MNKFQSTQANIHNNNSLYEAQKQAYKAAFAHYQEFPDFKFRETLIVMPTGTGKTGVMAILPYGISKGRVLIITPGKIVRKTVYEQFDSAQNPERTFWIKRNVIYDRKALPNSYLYKGYNPKIDGEKELTMKKLTMSDIVITNVHKLGSSNDEVNLMSLVKKDFFDMIIVDEAHHVAANMWKEALEYFSASKVIKLTATPFRSDNQSISTNEYDPIYEYTLGEAINDGLIKNIVKQEEIPGEIILKNQVTGQIYSLEKAKEILGNDFVSKQIAMDEHCSKQVIERTKDILLKKRKSYPNHQVLAVTCNDEHAKDICKWFNDYDLKATYVSTKSLSENEIEKRLNDFANGVYDVMVSIQMLGEGYDNPNISIISLFRPFKTISPYAQAIGRGLRRIYAENLNPIDNYCNVVYHQELGLEQLWKYYKEQETYGEKIKLQRKKLFEQLSFNFDELGFVERRPSPNASNTRNESDDDFFNSIQKILSVSSMTSRGLGKEDSFTQDGMKNYKQQLEALLQQEKQELDDYKQSVFERVRKGELDQFEADLLIKTKEEATQHSVNTNYSDFRDFIISDSLREDFTNWLNIKLEEFFNSSILNKEGFELFKDDPSVDKQEVNNIGYISRNIRQSLYSASKKHVSAYNQTDFAIAKQRVVDKLSFWLKQYGQNKE
ncbi:DEAD/DEAH box helicase, partial [Heyndrickxia faecalis]